MPDVVAQHAAEVVALCRRYGVRRLALFGSATRADFDPQRSDLDFLVEFHDGPWQGSSNRYFGLLHGLEDLFGRSVDLVECRAVGNPRFLEVAEQDSKVLYAA